VIAVLTCPHCEEQSDVIVSGSMGATDLLPDSCPECCEPWPIDILNAPETSVYA
jgi:hypothetical protein